MKRIKFKTNSNISYRVIILLISILLIGLGSGLVSVYSSGILVLLGSFLIIFELSRLFWHRTFVQHGKSWIIIKLNTILPRFIKFNDIKKIYVNNTHLEMALKSGEKEKFVLGWIERNDIDDLADIIVENSDAEYINEGMHEDFYQKD